MSEDYAIKIEHLSKVYKIFDRPFDRVKEALHPFHKRYSKDFYALNDVSFTIRKGETLGIIGKNGAGKSTLLKIITGVLTPTGGSVQVNGRVASLLELGAGFNPEMTGIENIYMNGTVMGYAKEEMDARLEDIIAFADIGDFICQPVKMYSSGMFARLAFAVNVYVEPDILIVDEALAVGDAFFQNKCFKKMQNLKNKGITLLFVSHDLSSVRAMCDVGLWLDAGQRKRLGNMTNVAEAYFQEQLLQRNQIMDASDNLLKKDDHAQKVHSADGGITLPVLQRKVGVLSDDVKIESLFFETDGKEVTRLQSGKTYTAKMGVSFSIPMHDLIFGFTAETTKGIAVLGINTWIVTRASPIHLDSPGFVVVSFTFILPKIQQGVYLISPAVVTGTQEQHIVLTWLENATKIEITNDGYNLSILEIDSQVSVTTYQADKVTLI